MKQLETLAKREAKLRGAITRNESAAKVEAAVQEIRHSQLAVLKARRALIEYEAESAERRRQIDSIAADELLWSTASIEDIVQRYFAGCTPNTSLKRTREE